MKRNVKKIIEEKLHRIPPQYDLNTSTMLQIKDMATATDGTVDIYALAVYVFTYGFELGQRAAKRKAAGKTEG